MSNRSLNEIIESNDEQNNDESNEKVITNLDELKSLLTAAAKPNEYIYWRFKCVSKNGMFVNSRYVVAPKSILFAAVEVGNDSDNKQMTFRFPNTAIKIHFHSNMTQVCSEYRQEKERHQHQHQQQQQQQKQPIVATTVVPKTPNNTNKSAQILLKKQIEQLGGVAVAVGGEKFEPHLSRGYYNNIKFLFY